MPVFNQSRSYIIRLIFIAVFLIIAVRLFTLQVLSGKYQQLAQANAVLKKNVYPPRGIIFDRKGKAILNNVLMYDLMVTPSEIHNVDTTYMCQLLEIDTSEFNRRVKEVAFKNGRFRPSIFEALLSPEKHARLEENMWRFGSGFYQPGDYVGRSGLEATYERILMGQRGVQFLVKDNKNRLVGKYENGEFDTAAIAGRGLQSYLDIELQQLAEKLLAGKIGAIVAIEPKTGGIIAMASAPDYDPNELAGGNFKKYYSK